MKNINNNIPWLSIIIPVFNVEKYIKECLDSVIKDDYNFYEIICVDDKSTDKSYEILEAYKEKYNYIKVLRHDVNKGLSESRNTGLINSAGKYVCFLDGDDLMADVFWDEMEILFLQNINFDIISYEIDVIYDNDDERKKNNKGAYYTIKNDYKVVLTGREMFCSMVEKDDYVDSACNKVLNREWLEAQKIKFVPQAYYEDSIFSLECYFKSNKVKHINNKLYKYRIRSNSIMTEKFTYKNEYWRVWQLSECLRFVYCECKTDREKKAVSKYARKMVSNIRFIYEELCENDKLIIGNLDSIEGLLLECFGLTSTSVYNSDLELEGLLSLIKSYEKVLLYGAGKVGKELFELLKQQKSDEKIIGFAVSNIEFEHNSIQDKEVKYIGNYNPEEIDLVVVSVSKDQVEMIKKAKENGFDNLRIVDGRIAYNITKRLIGK